MNDAAGRAMAELLAWCDARPQGVPSIAAVQLLYVAAQQIWVTKALHEPRRERCRPARGTTFSYRRATPN
jgi:hypothetical protein